MSARILNGEHGHATYELRQYKAIKDEIELYVKHISEALTFTKLFTSLTQIISSGDIVQLSGLLKDIGDKGAISLFSCDLGVARLMYKANEVYSQWKVRHFVWS